jgi:glyoxylase-like metal-dependent hydrolase (beta-lactamase superfamily II)
MRLGGFSIARVPEWEGPAFAPEVLFPDYDPAFAEAHAHLLGPDLLDRSSGMLVMSFHAYLLKTPAATVLIDTCIGNGKDRPQRPQWHRLESSFLSDLEQAGIAPEAVDFVLCTHLHWDHVGWNTRRSDGRWVPSFPNARYVFARDEVSYWDEVARQGGDSPHALAFRDSVQPILEAGQALLVDGDCDLFHGITIERAPGHTPGNVIVHARSEGTAAIFSGDVIHHPVQLLQPDWSTRACHDAGQSRTTRRRLLEQCLERSTLVLPAHFPAPSAGRVLRRGSAFWWESAIGERQ